MNWGKTALLPGLLHSRRWASRRGQRGIHARRLSRARRAQPQVPASAVTVKYEGQRSDKTHAVNGSADVQGQQRTFQCTFVPNGAKISRFAVNPGDAETSRPFANRLWGRFDPASGSIETPIGGFSATLAANGRGRPMPSMDCSSRSRSGLRAARRTHWRRSSQWNARAGFRKPGPAVSWFPAGRNSTRASSFSQSRSATRATSRMPAAIAWHPHFRIPSGDRRQARLRIPACGRVVVDNYDNLFPAGEIAPVANTPFAPGIWRGGIPG